MVAIVSDRNRVVLPERDSSRIVEPAEVLALEAERPQEVTAAIKDLHAMVTLIRYHYRPVAAQQSLSNSEAR